MAFSGVRISWLMFDKKSLLTWFARSASATASFNCSRDKVTSWMSARAPTIRLGCPFSSKTAFPVPRNHLYCPFLHLSRQVTIKGFSLERCSLKTFPTGFRSSGCRSCMIVFKVGGISSGLYPSRLNVCGDHQALWPSISYQSQMPTEALLMVKSKRSLMS